MKKQRRWLQSAIAASQTEVAALPWARATRSKPQSLKAAAPKANAARQA